MKKTESRCPVFNKCGACTHIDVPYDEQLSKKKEYLKGLLSEFGNVDEMVGMKDPFHYRCKVTGIFVQGKGGKIEAGNYYEGSKNIVPVNKCYLEDVKADAIIRDVAELLKSFKMRVFNERTGYGNFRYCVVRVGKNTGEIMLILVTRSPVFPSKNNFIRALRSQHPEITTVVQNINDRTDSLILGNRNNVLFGRGFIEDKICGLTFRISPGSFYQVNPVMAEKLYKKAVSLAELSGRETVLDAYCGTGTIGLSMAKNAEKVIGVELSRDAVKDAKVNAKINSIKNSEFYQGDAGAFLEDYYAQGGKTDLLVADPPRSGLGAEFITSVKNNAPDKLIYISCNPITLARDLKLLTDIRAKGAAFQVSHISGYDMFPFTEHCETAVLLERK